nr:hypothetical transcript [Hymenolepis microstoma]
MSIRTFGYTRYYLYEENDHDEMYINMNYCIYKDNVIGSPCHNGNDFIKSILHFYNATSYRMLFVSTGSQNYTIFFANNCIFSEPKWGEVMVRPSLPLFRFLNGERHATVRFAVKGANQTGYVQFIKGTRVVCGWHGYRVTRINKICKNMIIDKVRDRMYFDVIYTRSFFQTFATYTFGNNDKFVAVTLDWEHRGIPEEDGACRKYYEEINGKEWPIRLEIISWMVIVIRLLMHD